MLETKIRPNPKDVQPPRRSYAELCSVCKKIRVYKRSTSGMCPDCAADERRELTKFAPNLERCNTCKIHDCSGCALEDL